MNRHESGCSSMLYCRERDTLCLGIDYTGTGECKYNDCILDDQGYQKRQEAIRFRREELQNRRHSIRAEEQAAAARIRSQTKTREELLREEIHRREQRMNRYYTRGWTRLAEKESLELASLEREIRRTSQK